MSKIKVNEISTLTGTDITITAGKTITGTASQFKITGGTAGQAILTDGAGGLTFGDASSVGDVAGPSSSTDDALVRFDGTTGKLVQNSATTLTDAGLLTSTYVKATQFYLDTNGVFMIFRNGYLSFEGSTDDSFETKLNVVDPTADNTVLLPDASGTLATEAYVAANSGGDVGGLQNDIATLALHVTTHHSSAALNLPNTFIDQYQDDSGIDTTSTAMYTAGTHVVTGNPGAGLVGYANDSNTILLIHMDGSNGSDVFTDSSSNAAVLTITNMTMSVSSVDRAPIGGAAGHISSNDSKMTTPGMAVMDTEEDFTIEFWVRTDSKTDTPVFDFNTQDNIDQDDMHFEMSFAEGGNEEMSFELGGGPTYGGHNKWTYPTVDCDDDTWHHYAVVRDKTANSWFFYYDGVSMALKAGSSALDDSMNDTINREVNPMVFFKSVAFTSGRFTGAPSRMDEFRFSSVCRYPSGTTFVPNPGPITTATGNYTSTTETANATVSNMGIVVLYKNASGTATLDTDLIAEVSADGGTNWTAAPLTAGGTFSTGILIAKSNNITISNTGTAPKYRISFANQADGTKNTQVHGASLLY